MERMIIVFVTLSLTITSRAQQPTDNVGNGSKPVNNSLANPSAISLTTSRSGSRQRPDITPSITGQTDQQKDPLLASCSKTRRPVNPGGQCQLYPVDPNINARIKELRDEGTELLRYDISFPEYDVNPLDGTGTRHYKPSKWQRVFSAHGETLLTLAFNYDVLSLNLLTFGEKTIQVEVVDTPCNCFAYLDDDEKVATVRALLLNDFLITEQGVTVEPQVVEDQLVCHQIIKENSDGSGSFAHSCCNQNPETNEVICRDDIHDRVIDSLYIFMSILRVLFLLFGPLLLLKWFYKEPITKTSYVVPLHEKVLKTMLLKKVRVEDDSMLPHSSHKRDVQQFRQFRQLVKNIPADEIIPIAFKKLHILVDPQELISEKNIPVGIFRFLYDTIFMCSFSKHEPFASCCAESIFGSWSKRFLWFKLMDGSDCNRSCRTFCSWAHIFRFIGGLVLLGFIPLPYIIRIVIYYLYEESEVVNRNNAVESLNLTSSFDHGLFLYLTPSHGIAITMYVMYILSYGLLRAFRAANPEKFDEIIRGSIEDLRQVSYLESIRMLFAHLLLPFEKFGVICGLLVAALYWPFALPFCLLTLIFYCTPSLYLTGRLLVSKRPSWLRKKPFPSTKTKRSSQENSPLLSQGTTSFETYLLLNNISPIENVKSENLPKQRKRRGLCRCTKEEVWSVFLSFLVGLLSIINMYCLLFMYAEVIGVVCEVAVLSMMGTVVNASSAAKYVMLGFWIVLYTTNCFNNAYAKYEKLNEKVFAYIKDKLGSDIEAVTMLPEEDQQNTAFKYFSTSELKEYLDRVRAMSLASGSAVDHLNPNHITNTSVEDVVADKNCRLYWDIKSLVMFVDNKDVPRIPRKMFFDICEQDIPGCPGPVYKSMLEATKQLMYMVVFMVFVFIVVLSFGNIYDISNTNQLLLTLASGFLPFVVRFVLAPKDVQLELNTYSFHGRIHQLIFTYSQSWQVFDLAFEKLGRNPGTGPDQNAPSSGATAAAATAMTSSHNFRRMVTSDAPLMNPPDIVDPTHVDLLITVRDEEEDANLRSDPGSQGSNRSINSVAHRIISEDGHHNGSRSISGAINNPTNAQLQQMTRAGQLQSAAEPQGARGESHSVLHPGLKSQTSSPASTPALKTSPLAQLQSPLVNPSNTSVPASVSSPATYTSPPPPPPAPVASPSSSTPPAQASAASSPCNDEQNTPSPTQHKPQKMVDLVVDLAKGGVQVRGAESPDRAESSTNGIPLWTMSSPYKQIPDKDGEAHL